MEGAVWAASSDSEDSVTQEKDEETGAPSNTGHQGSVHGVAEKASTKDAQGYVNLPFIKKAASARNGWESMESVKAGAREKPPHKDIQDLVHFEKKDGNAISVPHCTRSKFTVNITAEDDISDHEPEVLATQAMDEDEEQVLVTQEDHGESSEQEYHSSTAEFGVSWKQNPRRSDVRRKKRNLTEDGPGQAYKLVKIERPQKIQVPSASAECGESTSDKTDSQWCESFQDRHLEGNYAAEAGKEKYHCTECNITCSTSASLNEHSIKHLNKPYKCPDCSKCFKTEADLAQHWKVMHEVFKCTKCLLAFGRRVLLKSHYNTAHGMRKKCPECSQYFKTEDDLAQHWTVMHEVAVPFKCTKCHLAFDSSMLLERHDLTYHGMGKNCTECNRYFKTEDDLAQHWTVVHEVAVPFKCTKCHLAFDSSMLLECHHHTNHGMGKKCPECSQYFFEVDCMMQHLYIIHNVIARFHCALCAITFNSLDELMMHEYFCTGGGRIQCTVCHVSLKNALQLREHQNIVHKADLPLRLPDYTNAFTVDEPLWCPF